jgi:hypothetical protein
VGRVHDRPVDPAHPLRLTIEVEEGEPLSGRIGAPEGEMRRFSSWLGLAAQLDRLVAEGSTHGASRAGEAAQRGMGSE